MVNLRVKIIFGLNSFLHTTGNRLTFGIDKSVYLDPIDEKTPAIPATSLKGFLRDRIESILRTRDNRICESPRPEKMCKDKENACIICKYFGSPRIKSPLIFEDAKLRNSTIDARTGVGIERRRKTAKEDHLFSYEIGYGNEFSTEISGHFEKEEDAYTASALLFLGAKSSFATGGGKSRGLGWIELKEFKASIDGKVILQEEIEKNLKEVLKL